MSRLERGIFKLLGAEERKPDNGWIIITAGNGWLLKGDIKQKKDVRIVQPAVRQMNALTKP